ncbi:hypothetical protein RJ639_003054 [Escallonia herrerae]|uniref:Uncharacterized protein n=1 Tax=Escallonia herrerae TaxID=1293975 RepID=A0AA88W2X9_9ASTE|nr:hypothetical protein RJ639_003054 [Escallonia herrerae]
MTTIPRAVCSAMTINESQGQTLSTISLYLLKVVFSHAQLYLIASRVTTPGDSKIIIQDARQEDDGHTKNVAHKEIFNNFPTSIAQEITASVQDYNNRKMDIKSTPKHWRVNWGGYEMEKQF